MSARGTNTYAARVAVTAMLLTAAVMVLLAGAPVYTEDIWWHVAAGEHYLREGLWPDQDPLLHTGRAGGPVQHEWLFGVLVAAVHHAFGFHGLRIAHAGLVLLVLGGLWSLLRSRGVGATGTALAVSVFVLLSWVRLFQLRPDLVTMLGTLALCALVLTPAGSSPSARRALAAVVVIGLWANLHSLFLVGVNLVVAALLGVLMALVLARWLGVDLAGTVPLPVHARRLGLVVVGALAAAAINPRGFEQHMTFLSSSAETAVWHVTDEWSHFRPFDWKAGLRGFSSMGWLTTNAVLLAFFVTAAMRAWRLARKRDAASLRGFDCVGFGLGLAAIVAILVSIRFLWMGFLPLLYVLARISHQPSAAAPQSHDLTGFPSVGVLDVLSSTPARSSVGKARDLAPLRRLATNAGEKSGLGTDRLSAPESTPVRWPEWVMALVAVGIMALFPLSYGVQNLMARFAPAPEEYFTLGYASHKYHAESVHFLRTSGVGGRLFNTYALGGFLGYWLSPQLRTFIDSRTEHYDYDVYLDYSAVVEMRGAREGESFLDVLDRHRVDVFLGIGFAGWWRDLRTTEHLHLMPGWRLVFRSYRSAVYLRDDPRDAENLRRVSAYYAREGVPFDPVRGFEPGRVIAERPDWARDHAMVPRGFDRLPASDRALVLALSGAYAEQVALDRELAGAEPRAEAPRRRLIHGLLRLDRLSEALDIAAELEALGPTEPRSRTAVALARRYSAMRGDAHGRAPTASQQLRLNRLLWRRFPADAGDTWPIEFLMRTEGYPLTRARDDAAGGGAPGG